MKKRILTLFGCTLVIIFIIGLVFNLTSNHLKVAKEKKVMAGFEALMVKKDLTVIEVIEYLDQFINTVSKEKASRLVLGLEQVQQDNLSEWQERYEDTLLQMKIARIYQNKWSQEEIEGIADEEIKRVLLETVENGFKVETAEGFFFPVIDYTFIGSTIPLLPRI